MKYTIEITETLQKQIIVNADNKYDAIVMAEELYYNGDEVLYAEDLKETQFEIIAEEEDGRK